MKLNARQTMSKIKKFLMKHFFRKKFEDNRTPGFVIADVGFGDVGFEARSFYIPERLLVSLETRIEEEFGDEGVQKLYSAGKKYGWEYAGMGGFPNTLENSRKEIENAFSTMADYVEVIHAAEIDYDFDFGSKVYKAEYTDPVILGKNDRGYIFFLGTAAGYLAYIMQNKEVESSRAEKLSENQYRVEIGKPEELEKDALTRFTDLDDVFHKSNYSINNRVRSIEAGTSLESLMKKEGCYKEGGNFYIKEELHISYESGLIHLIENHLAEIDSEQVLFELGFDEGKKIGLENEEELIDYLTGAGWGEVKIEDGIKFNYFPWHPVAGENDLELFRGFISGLMSSYQEDVRLSETEVVKDQGNLQVKFLEEKR